MATSFEEARAFLLAERENYARACCGFRWPDQENFNWALDWFDAVLARQPESRDRAALRIVETATGSETALTFAELSRRSDAVANYLRTQGVGRGDRVLLLLGNVVPLWETMLAAMKLGAVVIPATTLLSGDELTDRIVRGRARFIVAAGEHAGKFAPLACARDTVRIATGSDTPAGWRRYADAHDESAFASAFVADGATRADDPLLLYFTSGTTSRPKLVLHSHRSYPVGSLSTMYWIGLRPDDVHLNISSPGWAKHAWSSVFAPWNAGATVFIVNQPRFEANSLLAAIAGGGVTTLCAPPTVWRMLVQVDLASVRTGLRELVGAGEPLNPEIIAHVQAVWGLTIRDGFGQTETTAQIANSPGQALKPGAMGRPLPGYRVALLDAEGREVEEGEICLPASGADRPAGLMAGYADGEGDGLSGADASWYRTGDIARRDADGYLTFVGRADDVFKSSDYRISPFELESVLIEHEAVAEAAVIPAADPLRLAVPKAYVSLVAGAAMSAETARSIFAHARARLAPFKRIRKLELVTELPKTISGKIRRAQLRGIEASGARDDAARGHEYGESDFPDLRDE
ncbi:MAG: AMP-binding protein [Acetobacteraceae bacterium]|nr:AMP-binding protein [Acetobacteraceae bacterium]